MPKTTEMPQWMSDALDSIAAEMKDIEKIYLSPEAPIIQLRDRVKAILRAKGLMAKERIDSRWIGVHPDNRYGDGLVPSDVIALIVNIFDQGGSRHGLQDPTACEVPPPGHPRQKQFEHFNRSVVEGSGGQLPPVNDFLNGVTVTCGHTSMGIRCWQAGSPCEDTRFSVDGRLSLQRLKELQPEYAELVENGIDWDLIRWPVEDHFPFIPKLIQEAGNAGQQIAKAESRLEVMLRIRDAAARNARLNGGDPLWKDVETEAGRGGSPFKNELPHLITFCEGTSGRTG